MRNWLKEIRKSKNLTQEQLSEKVKISRAFLTQLELNKRNPSVQTAMKIAKVLEFNWTRFYE